MPPAPEMVVPLLIEFFNLFRRHRFIKFILCKVKITVGAVAEVQLMLRRQSPFRHHPCRPR